MMIKIRDDLFLAAESITKVELDSNGRITVVATDTARHSMHSDYGKSAYATVDRLNAEINAAQGGIERRLDRVIDMMETQLCSGADIADRVEVGRA